MSTVGLSFGSATSGTGFDVTTTVNSILAIQSGVETPWKAQIASLTAQNTAFSTIGTDLSTLSTSLQSLTDFDGLFASKEGSSSDTNVLTLSSAATTAVAGSHTVVVNSLAATSSNYSDEVTNASDTLSGSLSIQIGSAAAQTITVDSTSNTLTTLAQAINNGSYGVTASVVSDTNGSRLSLVSNASGTAGQITLSSALTDTANNSTPIDFSTGQTGANASLTVDGLATTSSSNTVSTAIPGVTFQLLSASPGTQVQVEITNDNTDIESAVQSFVTAYNAVNTDITTQEGNDSSGNPEPLFGDPTTSLIQSQLSTALFGGTASGSISSIDQLGITVNADGSLSLDADTLSSALNSSFSDVAGYFQNANSFGQSFTTTLNGLSSTGTTGAVYLATQQNTTEITALNTDITNEQTQITAESATLTTELNTANQELQAIPSQLNEVNELYSAITGYNEQQS